MLFIWTSKSYLIKFRNCVVCISLVFSTFNCTWTWHMIATQHVNAIYWLLLWMKWGDDSRLTPIINLSLTYHDCFMHQASAFSKQLICAGNILLSLEQIHYKMNVFNCFSNRSGGMGYLILIWKHFEKKK